MKQKLPPKLRVPLLRDRNWWLFCLGILTLKFILFAVDPLPKFWGGDSNTYIWTAVSGGIPEDRSYLYGYVIRWVALSTSSLMSLLILQVFAGAVIAIVCGWICLRIFHLPPYAAFGVGLLCCLDPLELYWERAIMTETLSLLFYALLLQRSFVYLKRKRIQELIWIQLIGVLMIGFRMSYLLLVYVVAVTLPILAFVFHDNSTSEKRQVRYGLKGPAFAGVTRPLGHIMLALVTMFVLHDAYQRVTGSLSHRKPKYLYSTGIDLLAFWAPALRPTDADDERLAGLIRNGGEFKIEDINYRTAQLHMKGFLIDRLRQMEPNKARQDSLGRRTALHALLRNPLAIGNLALQTYAEFWRVGARSWAQIEVPTTGSFTEKEIAKLGLVDRFHQVITLLDAPQPLTFSGWYYLAMSWYYYILLLSPAIMGLLIMLSRGPDQKTAFLFLNIIVLFVTILVFAGRPEVRYLQPISLLTLLTLGVATGSLLGRTNSLLRNRTVTNLPARASSDLPGSNNARSKSHLGSD